MFLVKYSRECFVDAESISHVAIVEDGEVYFRIRGEGVVEHPVEKEFAGMFVNHVQALNPNMDSVESAYVEINKA